MSPRSTALGSIPTARPWLSTPVRAAASEQAVERGPRLARPPPGCRRPLGRRHRTLPGRDAGQRGRRLHRPLPSGRDLRRRVLYWEADTAADRPVASGLPRSGYTHTDGKYAEAVGKGLDFLAPQKARWRPPRARARPSGMYCHAMATSALCEAYALTGDERLRESARRAGVASWSAPGQRRHGLALSPRRGAWGHEHPGLGGDGPEVGQGGRHPDVPGAVQIGALWAGSAGSRAARPTAWPATSPGDRRPPP